MLCTLILFRGLLQVHKSRTRVLLMADNAYPYDTSRVRELLKQKRKTRGIRSCFPCRHRKVRCDGLVPCSSCIKRSHPELCQLPPSSAAEHHGGEASSVVRGAPQRGNDANMELR